MADEFSEIYEKISDPNLKIKDLHSLVLDKTNDFSGLSGFVFKVLIFMIVTKDKEEMDLKDLNFDSVRNIISKQLEDKEKSKVPIILKPYKNYFVVAKPYCVIWQKIGENIQSKETTDLFKQIIKFIAEFSKGELRHIRLICTTLIYHLMRGMTISHRKTSRNYKIAKKNLCGNRPDIAKEKSRQDIPPLKILKKEIKECLEMAFKNVFSKRYRDVCEIIRTESASSLSDWINNCPDVFLTDKKLKYIGWLLNDRNENVRKAAIDTLRRIYNLKSNHNKMENFSERFFDRFLELLNDRSKTVVRSAIRLITIFYKKKLLDQTDDDSMTNLLWHKYLKVRYDAADFFMLESFDKTVLQNDLQTMEKFISLCKRGLNIEQDIYLRVFTLTGNFLEKIPLLLDWKRLFRLLPVDKNLPDQKESDEDKNKSPDDNPQIAEEEETKKIGKKRKSDSVEIPSAKRRYLRRNTIGEEDIAHYFEILYSISIYEDCCEMKWEDEKPDRLPLKHLMDEFLEYYPSLLLRYKHENSKLTPLLKLLYRFNYNHLSPINKQTAMNGLKDAAISVFENNSDIKISDLIVKALCRDENQTRENKINSEFKFTSLIDRMVKGVIKPIDIFDFNDLFCFCIGHPNDKKNRIQPDDFDKKIEEIKECLSKYAVLMKYKRIINDKMASKMTDFLKKYIKHCNDNVNSDEIKILNKIVLPALEICYFNSFWSAKPLKDQQYLSNYTESLPKEKLCDDKQPEENSFSISPRLLTEKYIKMSEIWYELMTMDTVTDAIKQKCFSQFCDMEFLAGEMTTFNKKLNILLQNMISNVINNSVGINKNRGESDDKKPDFEEKILYGASKIVLLNPKTFIKTIEGMFILLHSDNLKHKNIAKMTLEKIKNYHKKLFVDSALTVLNEDGVKKSIILNAMDVEDRKHARKWLNAVDDGCRGEALKELYGENKIDSVCSVNMDLKQIEINQSCNESGTKEARSDVTINGNKVENNI